MCLILPNVRRLELIGWPLEVPGKILDRSHVCAFGTLRVISTLEFLEHRFSKDGSQGHLLVTRTLHLRTNLWERHTRSVRRQASFKSASRRPTSGWSVIQALTEVNQEPGRELRSLWFASMRREL